MCTQTANALQRYGVALVATAVAAVLSLLGSRYLSDTPFLLFAGSVVVAAWYGGLGPGLLAAILGSLAGGYIFAPAISAHNILGVQTSLFSAIGFLLLGGFIAIIISLLRTARRRAETERSRAAFLAEVGTELARTLNYPATLRRVARLAVPRLADWCVVFLPERGTYPRQFAVAATNPATESLLAELAPRSLTDPPLSTPLRDVLRTGQSQLITAVSDSFLQSIAPDPEALENLRRLAPRSFVVVPLLARGQVLGALVLGTGVSGRKLGAEDLQIAEEVARRAAIAIDNARLYGETQAAVRRQDEALALLDTLLTAAPIGLGYLDQSFHFVRLNDAMAEMIGPPRTEILGRTVAEMVPRLWSDLDPLLQGVLETGQPVVNVEVNGETIAQPGVRRTWLVNYYPVCLQETEIAGIGVVVVEITERKRAEEERERLLEQLGTEQAWLRTVIERTPVGLILVEEGAALQFVANRRAEELLGRSIATMSSAAGYAGHLFTPEGDLCPFENLPGMCALRGETVGPKEFVIRRPDGGQVPVLITAAPIRDAENRILGSVVVFEDISTLKELERLREEWTAVIAHDLRQPVTIIKGYADRLSRQLRRVAPLTEQEKSLEHIRAAATNLSRMISDLLDVSRLEARRLTLEKRPVDFPSLVRAVVERMAAVTDGHPVRVQILDRIPSVELDPSRVEQVLDNLLSNAAKYSYPSSEIVTTLRRCDDQVEVVVTNRGAGLSSDELPHLFTRFFRTRAARERGIVGVGLGLYVTKGLVEAHGGKIWAESIPGQTTSFHVVLPVDGAEAERTA